MNSLSVTIESYCNTVHLNCVQKGIFLFLKEKLQLRYVVENQVTSVSSRIRDRTAIASNCVATNRMRDETIQ